MKINQHLEIHIRHLMILLKWIVLGITCGILVGIIAALFAYSLNLVTAIRMAHSYIVFGLPIAGLIIVALYHFCGKENNKGTNLIIVSIRSDEKIPVVMAPLIFISTLLTHLFGGSAGREGAALQLGGSLGQNIARALKMDSTDCKIMTMCSMSAAFSALFGTPLTATIFSMEVISVGIMHYGALVPCAISSIVAGLVAQQFGIAKEFFIIESLPAVDIVNMLRVAFLSILCAYIGSFFCSFLHYSSDLFSKLFKNEYVRILIGGSIIVILTLLFGTDYNGAGMSVIKAAIEESRIHPEAFLLKALFTAITLGCGYKGGEIVPSFFIGACFGGWIAPFLGLSPSFGAAIGLMVVFDSVTNCPVTSLFLCFELFGFTAVPLFLIADAIGYMLSGYQGLYSEQKIMYSKFNFGFIDAHTNKTAD